MLILWSFNTYSHKKCEVQDLGCSNCWRANPQRGRTNHPNCPTSGILSISDGKLPFVARKTIFSTWNLLSLNRLKLRCLEERLLSNNDVVMLSHADVTASGEFASVHVRFFDWMVGFGKSSSTRGRFVKNDELYLRLFLETYTFCSESFYSSFYSFP